MIRYCIPADGDDFSHPNVFRLKDKIKSYDRVALKQIKASFPLRGEFHFRFKSMVGNRCCVWLDISNDAAFVPVFEGQIIMKVARFGNPVEPDSALPSAAIAQGETSQRGQTPKNRPNKKSPPLPNRNLHNPNPRSVSAPTQFTPGTNPSLPVPASRQQNHSADLLGFSTPTHTSDQKLPQTQSTPQPRVDDLIGLDMPQQTMPHHRQTMNSQSVSPPASSFMNPQQRNQSMPQNSLGSPSMHADPFGTLGSGAFGQPQQVNMFQSMGNVNTGNNNRSTPPNRRRQTTYGI